MLRQRPLWTVKGSTNDFFHSDDTNQILWCKNQETYWAESYLEFGTVHASFLTAFNQVALSYQMQKELQMYKLPERCLGLLHAGVFGLKFWLSSRFQLSAYAPKEAVGDDSSTWVIPATEVGGLDWDPGFVLNLDQPRRLWPFQEWTSRWDICLASFNKKKKKLFKNKWTILLYIPIQIWNGT